MNMHLVVQRKGKERRSESIGQDKRALHLIHGITICIATKFDNRTKIYKNTQFILNTDQ